MSTLMASPDAEAAVLGAILLNPDLIIDAAEQLKPEDFATNAHTWLAAAAWSCLDKKIPPTVPALIEQLKCSQRWSEVPTCDAVTYTDFQRLMKCVTDVNREFIQQHTRIIRDLAFRRNGEHRLAQAAGLFLNPKYSLEFIQSQVGEAFGGIFNRHEARDPRLPSIIQAEEDRLARGDTNTVTCGLKWLDEIVGGLLPSENWVIDGAYKARKTTVLLNMLLETAKVCPVSIFTNGDSTCANTQRKLLAMTMNQEATRYGWEEYRVLSSQALMHPLHEERYQKLKAHAIGLLGKLPIRLYDGRDGVGELSEVARLLRRDHALHGTRVWAYDYAQTINHGMTDYDRVVYYAGWCQNLNGELGCTSISLSQVNEANINGSGDSYSPGSKGGGALPAMANVYLKVSYSEPTIKIILKLARDAPMGKETSHMCQPASGLILDREGVI